ncbi:DUF2892 domain-containing protein [Anaerobacillus alkaliphilus]|uniref:DUF2892 domain-containing protein n=1 Tax=Anaerobacillus alkaliphilus TaxID=1548597 RepID=A0A4Q0VW22_9BACI|nr:DUF2892 domain-containing protein [Anaerobacillus alkaliphilus]RXJ02379.1 DUF2892 domain-containing protein [Anaerobacillus alkaliphilus]
MKKVTPNIGLVNSFIRLTCGFTVLAWATSKLVKRPYSSTPILVAMMGAMKVAEGLTRFCPLTYLFEEKMEEMTTSNADSQEEVVNPS